MKLKNYISYVFVIAMCFLYSGSVYMSQCFRLLNYYDETTTDIITSGYNYILQALGIAFFIYFLNKKISKFYTNKVFIISLIIGSIFMALIQLNNNPIVIVLSGFVFNFLIGIYFGFYLTLFSQYVPSSCSGLSFGIAYAFGSVGTYFLSKLNNGAFLESKEIIVIYFIFISISGILRISTRKIAQRYYIFLIYTNFLTRKCIF